jgi:hypothetical protein
MSGKEMAVQDAAVHAFRFTNLTLNAAVMLHARLAGNKALVLSGAAVPPAAPGGDAKVPSAATSSPMRRVASLGTNQNTYRICWRCMSLGHRIAGTDNDHRCRHPIQNRRQFCRPQPHSFMSVDLVIVLLNPVPVFNFMKPAQIRGFELLVAWLCQRRRKLDQQPDGTR